MTGAALFPSSPLRRQAAYRLRLALAASIAGHLLLALVMATGPLGGKSGSEAVTPLIVRLAPQPAIEAVSPALPVPEIAVVVPRTMNRSRALDPEPRVAAATASLRAPQDAPALALPQVPDLTYYGARDLDVYPMPVAPLGLDRITSGDAAPGRVAVALQIDERGNVNKIEFTEPAAPDRLREELRAVLAATRFLPARKDGRAVKSRIELRVDLRLEKREP